MVSKRHAGVPKIKWISGDYVSHRSFFTIYLLQIFFIFIHFYTFLIAGFYMFRIQYLIEYHMFNIFYEYNLQYIPIFLEN